MNISQKRPMYAPAKTAKYLLALLAGTHITHIQKKGDL